MKQFLKTLAACLFPLAGFSPEINAQCVNMPPGIVALWRLENNTMDAANNHDGTPNGGPAYAAGKVGQSIQFDGVNDYVSVPHSDALQPSQMTVMGWVKGPATQPGADDGGTGYVLLADKEHGFFDATGWALQIQVWDGHAVFAYGNGTYFPLTAGATSVLDGNWHLLAGTFDDTTVKIYVDGVLDGSVAADGPPIGNTRNVVFGKSRENSRWFTGQMDEFMVFNRALTSSEIADVYAAGSAGVCPGTADLELSAISTNPNPAPYVFTAAKFTVQNKGAIAAQNVKVKINLAANGLPLQGGNEYTATQGSFSSYGNQLWTVGSLAPGASEVLTLNFFNLNNAQKVVYGQVLEATATGDDSTPGNGTCCTPAEDDEAATSFNGSAPVGSADLSLHLLWNGPAVNNGNTNFTLKITNAGPVAASGVVVKVDGVIAYGFTIKSASQGTFNTTNREWLVGNLPVGVTATLNYDEFLVDFDGFGPSTAFCQVKSSNQPDPDSTPGNKSGTKTATEDDEASDLVYPVGNAVSHDVSLTMTSNKTVAFVGDEVEFLIKTKISTPFTVGGITVKIDIPAGFELISGAPSTGSFNAPTGIWNIGYLENPSWPGFEKSFTLRLKVLNIDAPKTVFAQIMTSNGLNEPDSSPGNGTCCVAHEDDEAAVTISPASNGTCTNNLLQNPGFENDFSNWYSLGGTQITNNAKSGAKAVQICATGAGGIIQTLPATPGKNYTLLAWLKNEGMQGQGVTMRLKFMTSSWQPTGGNAIFVNTTSYVAYSVQATAPSDAVWVEVNISKSTSVAGCVYADDVCLTETGTGGGKPDLAFELSKPKFTPASIASGGAFQATLPFKNQGTTTAGDCWMVLYLSQDNILDNNDVSLKSVRFYGLSAGATVSVRFDAEIPTSFPTGNAFLFARLDDSNEVLESDEGNNTFSAPITVAAFGQPNIKIDHIGSAPSVLAGSSIYVDYKVTSNGLLAMPSHVQKIWLSTDNTLSANDLLLNTFTMPSPIPVCGSATYPCEFVFGSFNLSIAASTTPGLYYILVKLDADNAVAEVSETDNVGFATLTVTGSGIPNCGASGDYPWEDWISEVAVNGIQRPSGKSQYSNFTGGNVFSLTKNGLNTIDLTTTWSYFTYVEIWGVWIDYNHDQIFQPSERVYTNLTNPPANGNVSKKISGSFTLPAAALTGNAKMRVAMRRGVPPADPEPCGTFPYGEVEDYTVTISSALVGGDPRQFGAPDVDDLRDFTPFPNPTSDKITLDLSAWLDRPVRLELCNLLGKTVETWRFDKLSDGLVSLDFEKIPNGQYFLRCVSPGARMVVKKVAVEKGD